MSVSVPRIAAGLPSATVRVPFIIELPHEGFNPSITRWRGKLLLAWRRGWYSARIWLGELSEDHRLKWGRELDFSRLWPLTDEDWLEDPRLIVAGGKVLVAFTFVRHSNIFMALATLDENLELADCRIMDTPNRRWEKNWQFFEHDRTLYTVYYPNPHTVGWRSGQEIRVPAAHGARLEWAWGEVRGGTPPVRVGDEYFSFFHSSLNCHYVAGFYAFEAKPPFRVTRWPVQPCMVAAKDQWRGGHAVVFPGGAVYEDGRWLVAYGWQDAFCCLATFDHQDLLATLTHRELPPALLPPPGKKAFHTSFAMELPRPREHPVQPCVKLVTAFVDLNRRQARPAGKEAAAYLEHARTLFSTNPPLVVWLDCDDKLEEQIRALAEPFSNITVKTFQCEDTETWRAVAGSQSWTSTTLNALTDVLASLAVALLKSELVARSICEGDIPSNWDGGWIASDTSQTSDAAFDPSGRVSELICSQSGSIVVKANRPAGFDGPSDESKADGCSFFASSFTGPQALLLKLAGEILYTLRRHLVEGTGTHDGLVWQTVYSRHPEWFNWQCTGGRASSEPFVADGITAGVRPQAHSPIPIRRAGSVRKTLHAKCLYGLGNRITTICAAYACAKLRGMEPVFTWGVDWDCQCSFSDLFEPNPCIRLVDSAPEGGEVFSECVYYPEAMPQHLLSADRSFLDDDYWDAWRECAKGFRLKPILAIPHQTGFLAVHARQNDPLRAESSGLRLTDLHAFIASDSPSLKARMHAMMPSAWSLPASIVDRDYGEGSRSLRQIQDAARDMMMLTKASAILTIGRDSTFRNLASLGYKIPCFKYYNGFNP